MFHAERCTRLQALGHRCQAHLVAARTMPGISLHPSDHRPNWRQINFVVQIVQHLIGIGQRSSAMHTAQRLGHDCRIGVAGQRPATALPAQATLAVFSARLGCSPFDGGRLELFGVFGGSASFASSSAMRRSASSSRCHSARINLSFSAWLSWVMSGSAGTKSLNRDRRDRVNHHLAADQLLPSHTLVDSVKPGMSSYVF